MYDFPIMRFPLIDDGLVAAESEIFFRISVGLFFLIESFKS